MGGSLLLATALPGRRGGEPVLALVAGLLLGMQLVVRPDAVALAPAMAVAVAWWLASGRPVRAALLALGGVAATMGAGLLHARLISDQYSSDVYHRFDVARMAVAICVAAVVAYGLAALGRRRLPALLDGGERALGIVGGGARRPRRGRDRRGLRRRRLDRRHVADLVPDAAAPAAPRRARGRRRGRGRPAPPTRARLAGAAPPRGHRDRARLPAPPRDSDDQPWAARRFLPVIIPTAVALFAVAVGSATIALRGRGRALATVAVVVPAARRRRLRRAPRGRPRTGARRGRLRGRERRR